MPVFQLVQVHDDIHTLTLRLAHLHTENEHRRTHTHTRTHLGPLKLSKRHETGKHGEGQYKWRDYSTEHSENIYIEGETTSETLETDTQLATYQ